MLCRGYRKFDPPPPPACLGKPCVVRVDGARCHRTLISCALPQGKNIRQSLLALTRVVAMLGKKDKDGYAAVCVIAARGIRVHDSDSVGAQLCLQASLSPSPSPSASGSPSPFPPFSPSVSRSPSLCLLSVSVFPVSVPVSAPAPAYLFCGLKTAPLKF